MSVSDLLLVQTNKEARQGMDMDTEQTRMVFQTLQLLESASPAEQA